MGNLADRVGKKFVEVRGKIAVEGKLGTFSMAPSGNFADRVEKKLVEARKKNVERGMLATLAVGNSTDQVGKRLADVRERIKPTTP